MPPRRRGGLSQDPANGIAPRAMRRAVLDRDQWRCNLCHVKLTDHDPSLDTHGIAGHVIAHADGGPLTLDNLRAECRRCSNSGGARIGNRKRRERKATENARAATAIATVSMINRDEMPSVATMIDNEDDRINNDEITSNTSDLKGEDQAGGVADAAEKMIIETSNKRSVFRDGAVGGKAALLATSPLTIVEPGDDDLGKWVWSNTSRGAQPADFAECPWMTELLVVPLNACWPRLMTGPHPDAIGSYGAEFEAFVRDRTGSGLRWWQRLAARRLLEHDRDGDLVWAFWLLTVSRQSGKSILMRELCLWRISHLCERWGIPQEVIFTANVLRVGDSIQKSARLWAKKTDGWSARDSNGGAEVTRAESIWRLLAANSVYGFSSNLAVVDEAWKVDPAVIDDGIAPTQMERASTQIGLTSTANPRAGALFVNRRMDVLTGRDPDTLLLEWSADPGRPFDDPVAWRQASPHWHAQREKVIRAAVRRLKEGAQATEGLDPTIVFACEYLNVWPTAVGEAILATQPGDPLVPAGLWELLEGDDPVTGPLMFGLDSMTGETVAVSVAGRTAAGSIHVEAYRIDDLEPALAWVQAHAVSGSVLVLGATLKSDVTDVELGLPIITAATTENRSSLAALRRLVRRRAVQHTASAELATQLGALRVVEGKLGLNVTTDPDTWDLVRTAAWAVTAADRDRRGMPSIW